MDCELIIYKNHTSSTQGLSETIGMSKLIATQIVIYSIQFGWIMVAILPIEIVHPKKRGEKQYFVMLKSLYVEYENSG